MVEKAAGIAKSIMRKAREGRRDYLVDLMEYRNTPISGLGLSPAQMMFKRRLKTKLQISNKLLNAELFNNIQEKLIKRQNIQKPELKQEENDFYSQELTNEELIEIHEQEQDIEELVQKEDRMMTGNLTKGFSLIEKVMSRRKQLSAFDQVSEFDRGRIVAYRDWGLSFRKIGSRVGRN
ncbi:transposon Tf2-6 polyprotein [Trichonephila clavipes]|nr:transposon Tf2-6 polyprotein [Trichonephila clavipes]